MQQLDNFIDTTINRMSGESGSTRSSFYVDLRSFQQRITQNLVDNCMQLCQTRGLDAQRNGDGLIVTVDLNSCLLNVQQSALYNVTLNYARQFHGNHL